jgi:hypothetical protein
MIDNYTHREWECAHKILKHQGRVNRVLEEMKVSCPLWPRLATAGKKMQPSCNIRSEPTETYKKGKTSKTIAAAEGTSKTAKATDVLVQRKAEAAKTTLPPVVEKSTKLMKVNETLARQKTDAAKVAAADKEKKKIHDASPATGLEKKTSSKRKILDDAGKSTKNLTEEKDSKVAQARDKRPRIETSVQGSEKDDALATPQIQLTRTYPPKAKDPEKAKEQAKTGRLDSIKEAEAETERARVRALSATCPPEKWMKQTPEEEAASKRFWDHYEKTGELCSPDFAKYDPIKAVVGLIDIIDGEEELSYIDNDVPVEANKVEPEVGLLRSTKLWT